MVEIHLEESDRLDWALKAFKRKIAKAGILKDLRKKRYYVKPSEARQLKAAAARRRRRPERARSPPLAPRTGWPRKTQSSSTARLPRCSRTPPFAFSSPTATTSSPRSAATCAASVFA